MSILRYGKKILAQGGVLMGGGKGGGGGGGQAPQQTTQQSNQYTSLSSWAQPYITSILGAGQSQVFQTDPTTGNITGINPYNAYGSYNPEGGQYGINPSSQAAANAAVAGFTPLQQQAYQGASGLNLPNQFGPATGAALQGTGQALMAGQNYQNMATNPYATAAYMNPYLQASLQPQLNMIAQQGGIQGAQQQGAATQAGAFGGSRNALQQALTQQNTLLAQQQAIGQGYNQAFQAAQQAQQYGAGLGLQGSQAGIAGAGQLGNLGTAQLAAQQGILGLQNQFGGQQQQQAQNVINAGMTNYQTAQQYPMTQLSQLKSLISGIPVSDVTTTQQQAQPGMATQLAGLGTAGVAGLALANRAAEGGLMDTKRMASGGIASLNRKALLAPETMSPQTLQRSTQNGAIAPQVSGIAKAIQLNEQVNAKNADALSKPPAQGTIMDELEAKASAMDQEEMIPKAMAVLKHKMDRAIEAGDMPLAKRYAAELQQLAEIAQQEAPAPEGIEQIAPQVQQVAQAPEQGIDSATSNLPEQTMAQGGIASFVEGGGIEAEGSYLMHPDVQRLVSNGEISPKDARWMSDYAFTKGDTRVGTSTSDNMKDMSQRMQNYVNRMEKGEVPIPKHMAHEVKVGGNLSGLNPRGGGGVGSGGSGGAEIKILQNPRAMKDGGIVGYARGGSAQMLADADEEERLAADEEELYGTGAENDFIQSIMPAARQSGTTHPSAAVSVRFEPKDGGIEALGSHKYAELVAKEAKRQGRDPNVILKMLQKETGGLKNPETARSKAGAIGIAQFMPKTAKQYGINPEIPEEAAYGMVKHFGYLEDKYGDPKLAMAAYNWGEGNLNKWLKHGADPRKLPQETRKYASLAQGGIASFNGEDESLVETSESKAADELARERARGTSTAGVNKRYIETLNAAQNSGPQTTAPSIERQPKPLTGLEALQSEILQDIRSRKEESKKTREQNNMLALMQAGLGVAASKNIHPLGAIGEGGMQGLGALAQYRKHEGEEAKDIGAQQLGIYRFGAVAENAKVLQDIKQAQQDLRKTPEERARDEAEKEYSRQVEAINKRQAEHAKQAGGELDPYYQEQYDAQRAALRKQIYDHFKVPVQTEFKLPPIKPKPVEIKPTGYQKIMPTVLGGMSKEDMDALQWANEHPDDPRADAIKKRLGK